MGTKRSYSESNDISEVHESRKANLQQDDNHTQKRARRFEQDNSNPASVNQLKRKIRNITRLLAHASNLPADVRIENERALAGYKQDLEVVEDGRRKAKMIKKYHMVRFFERQKATRQLKKLKKRLSEATNDEETKSAQALIHNAEVDLNYTIYCPLDGKYTSLYPKKEESEDEQTVTARQLGEKPWLPLWRVVEKGMKDGTLNALRNSTGQIEGLRKYDPKPDAGVGVKAKRTTAMPIRSKKSEQNGREKPRPKQETAHESDGGFFEE